MRWQGLKILVAGLAVQMAWLSPGVVAQQADEYTLPSGVSVQPRLDVNQKIQPLAYPPSAKREGVEGEVTLSMCVTLEGVPHGVQVAETSGDSRLDQAAAVWASGLVFIPALAAERPVEMCGYLFTVIWELPGAPVA